MAVRRPPKRVTRRKKPPVACIFCKEEKEPNYKDYEVLKEYLTDRAKIVGTNRTGFCNKHQRKLTIAIKRARHLALLPFAPTL